MQIFDILATEQIILLGAVFIGLIYLFQSGRKGVLSRQAVPGMMTSLGILGTFIGVLMALLPLDFSPGKINESIEGLLAGMAFAFFTSVAGMASALVTKWRWSHMALVEEEASSPEHQDIAKRLDAIKDAIVGDADSSMVTQMQKMRDENRDGFKKFDGLSEKLDGLSETIKGALVESLENLIKEIREVVGKQLGESLRQLVERIEDALIKKFGETFKEFNDAVQALNKWQAEYRDQVEKLTAAFAETAKGIEKIKDDCAKIPEATNKIEPMISAATKQLSDLEERIGAFAEMKKQAEGAFPEIRKNLEKICEDLQSGAAGFDGLEKTITSAFESATNAAKETSDNMRQVMEKAHTDAAQKVEAAVVAAGKAFAERMNEEIDQMARKWGQYMVAIAERYTEQMSALDAVRADQNRPQHR